MTPNYSFLTRKELLLVAYGLWSQIEELSREVERLRSVRAAMEANIDEKWEIIEAMSRKGGHHENRL
jgi:hypothetical protein